MACLTLLVGLPVVVQGQTTLVSSSFDPNNAPVKQLSAFQSGFSPSGGPSVPSGVAVGRTAGSFGVSGSGTANYSIPFWSPPGIAGLSPSLGLIYSSDGGDGWYGVGWGLAGASSVTRCARTVAQDGVSANVFLTTADQFCLDGKRLRSFAGTTYGGDNAQYQTEIADFSLVVSHGALSTGPSWFEVHGKNGLIYQYGNTSNSALVATGTTSIILTWALNRITDRFGNHIDFDYFNDTSNQVIRPITIAYTTPGTTIGVQTTPNYQVTINYVSRTGEIPTGFVAGAQFVEPVLVNTVTVNAWNGSAYAAARTYNLNYTLGGVTGRSTLTSVQECSPTQCFPATTVGYQNGSAGWSAEVATAARSYGLIAAKAIDLNGDGIDDILYVDDTGTNHWFYLLGSASGAYSGPYDTGLASSSAVVPLDYNSDGKMDLLVRNASGNWRVMFYQGPGVAFTYTDTAIPAPANSSIPGYVIAGDVDGDGRDDLIYAVSSGSSWTSPDYIYYRLNTGSGCGPKTGVARVRRLFRIQLPRSPRRCQRRRPDRLLRGYQEVPVDVWLADVHLDFIRVRRHRRGWLQSARDSELRGDGRRIEPDSAAARGFQWRWLHRRCFGPGDLGYPVRYLRANRRDQRAERSGSYWSHGVWDISNGPGLGRARRHRGAQCDNRRLFRVREINRHDAKRLDEHRAFL